jgi:hypothetical protein
VRVQVENASRNPAPRSVARFYLATPRGLAHPGTGWDAGSLRVPALKPRKRFRATARLKVPKDIDEGAWYVEACADADNKLKESREKNNCRHSRSTITISISHPPPTSLPVADSYPGLQGSGNFHFSSDPNQMGFQIVFNQIVDQIQIWVPRTVGGGQVLSAPNYGCGTTGDTRQLNGQTYSALLCELKGAVSPNTPITGIIRTDPAPSPGMGGYLYGSIGNENSGGPFTMTGP